MTLIQVNKKVGHLEYFNNRTKKRVVSLPLSGYAQMMLPSFLSLER